MQRKWLNLFLKVSAIYEVMKKIKVGIIVDNPNRDLEGLVLVATQLAMKNFEVFLIPMYKQRYFLKYQKIDIVILNYLRPNNLEIFLDYKRAGISVALLDTEGVAGRDLQEYADFVTKTKMSQLIDLYMFWGPGQMKAVENKKGLIPRKTVVTGCPRFDFFEDPWKKSINYDLKHKDFILFNTNFPIVNPLYSEGQDSEYKTMLKVGFTKEYAENVVNQNLFAFRGIKNLIKVLAEAMPNQQFIIRPHPFEDIDGYKELTELNNIRVTKNGSANAMIFYSKCLIHLNCTTAIEAAFMDKPIYSPSWLNNKDIYRDLPQLLSDSVNTEGDMVRILKSLFDENIKTQTDNTNIKNQDAIKNLFHLIDGKSSLRVSESIENLSASSKNNSIIPRKHFKEKLKNVLLNLTEFPLLWQLREKLQKFNKSKYFSSREVNTILNRLIKAEPMLKEININDLNRIKFIKSNFSDVVAVQVSAQKISNHD